MPSMCCAPKCFYWWVCSNGVRQLPEFDGEMSAIGYFRFWKNRISDQVMWHIIWKVLVRLDQKCMKKLSQVTLVPKKAKNSNFVTRNQHFCIEIVYFRFFQYCTCRYYKTIVSFWEKFVCSVFWRNPFDCIPTIMHSNWWIWMECWNFMITSVSLRISTHESHIILIFSQFQFVFQLGKSSSITLKNNVAFSFTKARCYLEPRLSHVHLSQPRCF